MTRTLAFSLLALIGSMAACGSTVEPESAGASTGAGVGGAAAASTSPASSATTASTSISVGQGGAGASGGGGASVSGAHVTAFVQTPDGIGIPSVPVVVNDESGAVVSQTSTGMDGKAQVIVPAGGLVAIYPKPKGTNPNMEAVMDPPDGSTIMFLSYVSEPQVKQTTFEVTATGYAPDAASIALYGCTDFAEIPIAGATTLTAFSAICTDATTPILALAYDASMNLQSWGFLPSVATNPGSSVPVAIAVDQTALQMVTDTLAPVPAGGNLANASIGIVGLYFAAAAETMSPGATASFPLTLPAIEGVQFDRMETARWEDGGSVHGASHYQVEAGVPAPSLSFDPTAVALVTLNPVDTSDALHPKVSWTVGPGPQGDCVHVILAGSPVYEIFLPPGTTSFRLPDVPAALTDYDPSQTSKWDVYLSLIDQDGVGDWSQAFIFNVGEVAISEFVTSDTLTP